MQKNKTKIAQESFYSRFVEHDNDVVGLLSYALYQKAWHKHKEETLNSKYPDGAVPEIEYKAYQAMFEGQIIPHRKIAEEILNKRYEDFANKVHEKLSALDAKAETICDHSSHIPSIREKVHKTTGFFGVSFWQNVVASAAFPIILGLIILLYKLGSDAESWPNSFWKETSKENKIPSKKDSIPHQ